PAALPWACPILVLWALAKPITLWLNRSPHALEVRLSDAETNFLRKIAWRTWLYFAHFSTERSHGLTPDNVQQNPEKTGYLEALRISPTNAGLQLNARQSAVVLGYLTLPEYTEQTLANLRTLDGIPKWKGHLLNWYTTDTLERIAPYIASTVDSGNLLASLCSLRQGTLELLRTPMLPALKEGLVDILNDSEDRSDTEKKIRSVLRSAEKGESGSGKGSWNG